MNKSSKFTIPSDYAAGRDVQNHILDDVVNCGFTGQNLFAIKLALEEAIINGIKHGNRLDAAKKVRIEARITLKRFTVSVEDEGPGFHRAKVPDPTLEENLEKCSGRGILLMEAYMTRVRWDRGGRRITLVKENDQPGH